MPPIRSGAEVTFAFARRDQCPSEASRERANRNFPGTLGAVIVAFGPKTRRAGDLALN
jgi:hypothetical protein